jgi:immunity protein 35 of polymorphic toxin system
MISETEAFEIATQFIASMTTTVDGGVAIASAETIRKPYGWIFFYNSRRYLETGDPLEGLGGNGPVVVEQAGGRVHPLPSSSDPSTAITEFEKLNGFDAIG